MKYFIDFEATQYSEEIISVGCIREDGQTFYSLVAPVDGKITPFITNLTGITSEIIKDAMSPDYVFERFYNWAFLEDESPDFYCWGDSDVGFLRQTFKRTDSRMARFAIGYVCGSLRDYSEKVSKLCNLGDKLSLIRTWKCFDSSAIQNHNALDDAVMLYNIYKASTREDFVTKVKENYPQHKINGQNPVQYVRWTQEGFPVGTICILNKHKVAIMNFPDKTEAAKWVLENKITPNQRDLIKISSVEQKILKACNGTPYCGLKWVMVKENN